VNLTASHFPQYLRAILLSVLVTLIAPLACAQSATEPSARPAGVAERFPPGTINSVETAETALSEVAAERIRVEAQYSQGEQACYPKFFATSCLDAAKELRRAALSSIRPVEVEANAFKRRAKVAERDKALAEKRADEQAQSEQRAKDQEAREAAAAQKGQPARAPGAAPAAVVDRSAAHEAKLKRLQAEEAAGTAKRAANVADYEKKAKDALARQQEVAAKKAEKEREREAKAAAAASKP
jgi:hypothetical protein